MLNANEAARRGSDCVLPGVGSHRKTEAIMVPVAVFEQLTAERAQSATQASASVLAEGLTPSPEATAIVEQWSRGEISTIQMRELVRRLHNVS